MDLEGFCITMATHLHFFQILFSRDVTGPTLYICVQFRSDPLRNRDGVRARGHKPYCFYSMMEKGGCQDLEELRVITDIGQHGPVLDMLDNKDIILAVFE